jgi:CRISPR-associated protein Cmr3
MAIMFKYLITIQPLGLMYGSAGAFLSPENLVGQSGTKFPPDAATLSGLIFSANKFSANKKQKFVSHEELTETLRVAGPFWAFVGTEDDFYVPLPRHKVIGKDDYDEWTIEDYKWCLKSERNDSDQEEDKKKEESEYRWLRIDYWDDSAETTYGDRAEERPSVAENPWKMAPFLHPQLKKNERRVLPEDGLFLENAVQMQEDTCLVYLSTHPLKDWWYQFGGEGHMVEVRSTELRDDSRILKLLQDPIQKAFALITPGVWGSNQLSYRYPKHSRQQVFAEDNNKIMMLTDKAASYRYRIGYGDKPEKQQDFRKRDPGRLSRGRYAVPPGSVYVLREPLNQSWWNFPKDWFPEKGLLQKFGCGLCLPVHIEGVDE